MSLLSETFKIQGGMHRGIVPQKIQSSYDS